MNDREDFYRAACEWDSMREKGSLEPRMKPLPGKGKKKPSLDRYDHRRE
jgi:hypothetical protein